MKKLLFTSLTLLTLTLSAQAQNAPAQPQTTKATDNPNAPKFKFKEETYDFGNVKEGPLAEHIFEFKNVGKEPLIIQSASAGCSCTTPEWPKEPILPGKKGQIIIRYKTEGRPGPFMKDVFIVSNAVSEKERFELHIKGTVVPAATTAATTGGK